MFVQLKLGNYFNDPSNGGRMVVVKLDCFQLVHQSFLSKLGDSNDDEN